MYLSEMDFIKVVYGGELLDEETLTFYKSLAHIMDTNCQEWSIDYGKYKVPHPENVIEEADPGERIMVWLFLGP